MGTGRSGAVFRPFQTLYTLGTVGNLSDEQLLERFLARREGGESAFEALVARHGPMVHRICRQILSDPHDAEDAFQATFFVLVRRAEAIRNRDSLACWLHGVARRVALRARTDGDRRRRENTSVFEHFKADGRDQPQRAELRSSVREEIELLPEKYRAPVVLCDLEGQTHAEAAETLSWPVGTVSGRLSRARELLRSRISRRGVALSSVGVLSALSAKEATAKTIDAIARRTARSAALLLNEAAGASTIPGSAFTLAETVIRGAFIGKMYATAATLLIAGTIVGMAALGTDSAVPDVGSRPHAMRVSAVARSVSRRQVHVSRAPAAPPVIRGHSAPITSVAVSPGGRVLASGSRDTTVKLWDLRTGQERNTLRGHSGPVLSLAFAHDGKTLASSSEDHTVRLWDVDTGRETLTLSVPPEKPCPLALDFGPQDPSRGGAGRDQCANGSAQPACPSA